MSITKYALAARGSPFDSFTASDAVSEEPRKFKAGRLRRAQLSLRPQLAGRNVLISGSHLTFIRRNPQIPDDWAPEDSERTAMRQND